MLGPTEPADGWSAAVGNPEVGADVTEKVDVRTGAHREWTCLTSSTSGSGAW